MVWDFPAPLLTPGLCLGFAPQQGTHPGSSMWLSPGFHTPPHVSKTVGPFLTPPGITLLLTSFLAWFLPETGPLQSYHCI